MYSVQDCTLFPIHLRSLYFYFYGTSSAETEMYSGRDQDTQLNRPLVIDDTIMFLYPWYSM